MNKPIIAGCRAVVVNCFEPNLGKIVRVGEFIGKIDGFDLDNWWAVDKPMFVNNGETKDLMAASESTLRRIDDDYRTTTWENIEALTGSDLNPNKETVNE